MRLKPHRKCAEMPQEIRAIPHVVFSLFRALRPSLSVLFLSFLSLFCWPSFRFSSFWALFEYCSLLGLVFRYRGICAMLNGKIRASAHYVSGFPIVYERKIRPGFFVPDFCNFRAFFSLLQGREIFLFFKKLRSGKW